MNDKKIAKIDLEDLKNLTKQNDSVKSPVIAWFIAGLVLGITLGAGGAMLFWLDKHWGEAKTSASAPPPATTASELATIESDDPNPTLQQPTRPVRSSN